MPNGKFEIGQTYWHNFAGDSTARVLWTVKSRTAKSITIDGDHFGTKTRRVTMGLDGCERVSPLGKYSMSPVLHADHMVGPLADMTPPEPEPPAEAAQRAKMNAYEAKLEAKRERLEAAA